MATPPDEPAWRTAGSAAQPNHSPRHGPRKSRLGASWLRSRHQAVAPEVDARARARLDAGATVVACGPVDAQTVSGAQIPVEADGAGRADAGAGAALHAEPVVVHVLDVHGGSIPIREGLCPERAPTKRPACGVKESAARAAAQRRLAVREPATTSEGRATVNAARLRIWDENACRRVHEATLAVLAETGIEVKYAPAAEIFARAGARVDGTRVRIPAELVEAALEERAARLDDQAARRRHGAASSSTPTTRTAAPGRTSSTSATRTPASAAASVAPTSRAWRRSARSCPTSTS